MMLLRPHSSSSDMCIHSFSAAIEAVRACDLRALTALAKRHGQRFWFARNERGWSLAHEACSIGQVAVLQHMLSARRSAVTEAGHTDEGSSLFHVAAKSDQLAVYQFLRDAMPEQLTTCVDPHKAKETPLHTASAHNCLAMAQQLVADRPEWLDALDKNSATPFFRAMLSRDTEATIRWYLSEHTEHCRESRWLGRTPALHTAAVAGNLPAVQLLADAFPEQVTLSAVIADGLELQRPSASASASSQFLNFPMTPSMLASVVGNKAVATYLNEFNANSVAALRELQRSLAASTSSSGVVDSAAVEPEAVEYVDVDVVVDRDAADHHDVVPPAADAIADDGFLSKSASYVSEEPSSSVAVVTGA